MTFGSPFMAALQFRLRPIRSYFRMLLSQIGAAGKRERAVQTAAGTESQQGLATGGLGGRDLGQGQAGGHRLDLMGRVGAAGGAFLGAGAEGVLDDLVDRAGATAAFGAAAKAAIDLPCRARHLARSAYRAADVVIAQNIARTDDQGDFRVMPSPWIIEAWVHGQSKKLQFQDIPNCRG